MRARIETAPGCFIDCPSSRQRILDAIEDPSVKKLLVMRWWEHGEITPGEAQEFIRNNKLEAR